MIMFQMKLGSFYVRVLKYIYIYIFETSIEYFLEAVNVIYFMVRIQKFYKI